MKFRLTPVAAALTTLFAIPSIASAQDATATAPQVTESAPVPAENVTNLPTVKVVGERDRTGYTPDKATIGGRVPTEVRDIPQTVNIVNRAVLDAQNATSLTDALRNVPGITMTSGEGGQIGDNVNLRGFTARTDIYLDGVRDRGQYKRDTFALESVEVLKGPSSLFFGRGSTGGVINQVSKTPTREETTQISASLGTDDYYRTTVDVNRPLSDTSAVRVALMWQDVSSTRDVVENKDWGVAPSLRVALSKQTDLTLSGLVLHNRDTPDYGIPFSFGKPSKVSSSTFYGDTDDFFNQDTYVGKLALDHRFNSSLKLRNQFQASQTNLAARPTPYRVCTAAFNKPAGTCPVSPIGTPVDQITVQSDRRDREITDTSVFNQTDLVADFSTGSLKHTLIGGVEIGRDMTKNQGYTWSARVLDNLGTFEPNASPTGLTRARAATHTEGTADTFGIYVNETLTITPEWKVVAGLRRDSFDADAKTITNSTGVAARLKRDDDELSYRGGVIYQPDRKQSYYVSYGTSFNPSAEAVTLSAAQSLVEPETTRSYEAGAKFDLIDGDLSVSSALFRVEKNNARTTDPVTSAVSVEGNTRVQGFELGMVGRITSKWQIIAGYTYLDSELVKSKDRVAATTDPTVDTSSSANPPPPMMSIQGNELANTPKSSGSLWTTYSFLTAWEIGGGAYYVGDRYITTSNLTSVNSYWRVDGTLAYRQPKYDVQLNIQNVLDKDYYDAVVASEGGRATPGRGRTAIITGTYRF